MTTKRKLTDVFKTVGLPEYTYVKPRHFGEIRADIEAAGKHLLIEGPSGIGKTCVVYAVFEELKWTENDRYLYLSCRDPNAAEQLLAYLESSINGEPPVGLVVADDFHILAEDVRHEVGARLKRLSDRVFSQAQPGKVVLIGIPAAGTSILANANDLGPRLGSYRFRTADDPEISHLIDEGENELNVLLDNREAILAESSGNFWLAQYICSKICATNEVHETCDDVKVISFDIADIRQRLMAELTNRFMPAATTFAKGKKWRPGGNKPYLEIILAVSKIPEMVVPFDSVLGVVQERRRPGLKAVKSRIKEVIFDPLKSVDLRKQIAFEEDYFSLEDPLFRYFLTNMPDDDLYRELGVVKDKVDQDNAFTYEVGFSFAGEARALVEFVNSSLKSEDSVTFYDFDQQAFLLAEDLEKVLPRVYSESCRYYLVFLESHYLDKVWTRFEKDIMTRAGRSRHIVPVVLEHDALGKLTGLPSSIGMVDLSGEWELVKQGAPIEGELADAIVRKLVAPLIEKVSTSFQEV